MENDETNRPMQDLKPTVWIGKQGCTETMISEIVVQLKKRHTVKVKWLQNTEVDPEAVAREAKAVLVGVRGRTMVLQEKKKSGGQEKRTAKKTVSAPAKETARSKVTRTRAGRAGSGRTGSVSHRPGLSGARKRQKE